MSNLTENARAIHSTSLTPIARCEIFFFVLYHTYRSALRMVVTPPVTFNWPKKLANHGVLQLLPLEHHLWAGGAQTKHTGLILTSWANIPTLCLGIVPA
jgi:hypothetical protein